MCGHQRSFRIYKYDKSDDELKNVLVLGAEGPIVASERDVKLGWLFYSTKQATVMIDTYKSHELYEYDKLTPEDLSTPKRQKKYKFVPFIYSREPTTNRDYREFLLRHRVARDEFTEDDDLNLLFALDKIKERARDVRFNVFDFLMEHSEDQIESAEEHLKTYADRFKLKMRINTMRLNFPVANPVFEEKFNYNHLVYRTNNLNTTHRLTQKMLQSGFLCLKAKLEDINDLERFTGWGLHILDPMINGIALEFIVKEIQKSLTEENSSRKLTALTRVTPEKEPLLYEDEDLDKITKYIKVWGLEISFRQDEEYDIGTFTLASGVEAALVVKHIHYTKYSSIAFIHPYSDIMLKFIASGCENFFM